jgi:hypothetical protein
MDAELMTRSALMHTRLFLSILRSDARATGFFIKLLRNIKMNARF